MFKQRHIDANTLSKFLLAIGVGHSRESTLGLGTPARPWVGHSRETLGLGTPGVCGGQSRESLGVDRARRRVPGEEKS